MQLNNPTAKGRSSLTPATPGLRRSVKRSAIRGERFGGRSWRAHITDAAAAPTLSALDLAWSGTPSLEAAGAVLLQSKMARE